MKKFLKTFALALFCAFALTTFAFADVAVMPMIITIGAIYLLIAAIVVIAIALIIKLVRNIIRNRNK